MPQEHISPKLFSFFEKKNIELSGVFRNAFLSRNSVTLFVYLLDPKLEEVEAEWEIPKHFILIQTGGLHPKIFAMYRWMLSGHK